MKRCPECRRDYYDDSLHYCLDDGSVLLDGPAAIQSSRSPSFDEDATAIFHSAGSPSMGDDPTRAFTNNRTDDTPNSIAILPFVNMSRDEDAEYLSDGLAEELLNVLSKIDGLRVAGRTSSFSFKGKQTTFREIGQLLNVSSVLEGSVRMAGKRVRISVQLVNVSDGFHLWSETYDRTLEDIFEIQDDIAQSVVGELRSRLVGKSMDSEIGKAVAAEVAGAAKGRTQIPEAHRLRLLARHLVDRRTKADIPVAIEYLQTALNLDPENALCWVEFGNAHFMAGLFTWDEAPLKYFESARRAAEKALSIDPDLAVGHALLARIQSKFEWDLSSAEASVRRAEELAPEDPFVLGSVGLIKLQMGRFDAAIEVLHRGLLFDPLNISILDNLSYATLGLGLLNEAETAERRALEIVPQKPCSHAYLSLVMLEQGRMEEARAEAGAEPDESWRLWAAAIVENAAGRPDEACSALDELILKYAYDSAFQIAEVYSIFGQADEAFKWLDTAIAQRDGGMTQLKWSTLMRPLHSDPRWLPLLKKVGFPDENA